MPSYYLQSRYYRQQWGRFLNADLPEIAQQSKDEINGLNLFAYCCNDPVNNEDPSGYKYIPFNAKKYAKKWWNSINPYYGSIEGGDCANFVSQCLKAGGVTMDPENSKSILPWFFYNKASYSRAWVKAKWLYIWLRYFSGLKKKVLTSNNKNEISDFVRDNIKGKGHCTAVIFFMIKKGSPYHSAISGKVALTNNKYLLYYYAHTNSRDGTDKYYQGEGKVDITKYLGTFYKYVSIVLLKH